MDFHIMTLVIATVLVRMAEHHRHKKNYPFLKAYGGREKNVKLMRFYYFVNSTLLPAALVEGYFLRDLVPSSFAIFASILVILMVAMRSWAIVSLGGYWSMALIHSPYWDRVEKGPYKFINHPEYFSRLVEGLLIAAIFSSWLSGLGFLIITIVILSKITRLEKEQMLEIPQRAT